MNQLRNEMTEYGYSILDALVVDIDPDRKVKNSMNEINAAKRLRQAAHHKVRPSKERRTTARAKRQLHRNVPRTCHTS